MFLIASIGYFFTKNDMFSYKQSFANESDTDGNAIIQDQTDLNDLKNEYDFPPFPSQVKIDKPKPTPDKTLPDVMPTTIEGGMVMRNDTSFDIDVNALLSSENNLKLSKDGVQVLIVHTHGSEAYSADKTSEYKPTDNYRTQDKNYSIIRVGDELTSCLESYGITVLHDRDIYDYPSYTGSYVRSGEAVEQYLSEHPEIKVVFDIHRDAIGSGDIIYKTLAEGDGKPSSQIMLLVGTG